MKVKDHKALALSLWNRYFKAFNRHFFRCGLEVDLSQTFEIAALATKYMNLADSGKEIQKIFRTFMSANGFRKQGGYWVIREFQFNYESWKAFEKRGTFPKREETQYAR